ncbi:MAG: HsdM family class I SAM-dependent methyltransferase, partial [Promethearchaeota archaeon]
MDSITSEISSQLDNLKKILINHKIHENRYYKKWCIDFKKIYGSKDTNIDLFVISVCLYFIGLTYINEFIFDKNEKCNTLNDIHEKIKKKIKNIDIIDFKYFEPVFFICKSVNFDLLGFLTNHIFDYILELGIEPEYYFDYFIQNIIPPLIRHKSGEFYTPPFLVKKMVEETYSIGDKVLDPCCGTGNFLIEIIKKIRSTDITDKEKILAFNNLSGQDINPISIYLTKINFLYLLKEYTPNIKFNLSVVDSLFPNNNILTKNFNLIIGNPPWYTYSDITSIEYQEKVKSLAKILEIKPLPKNILNIEISTLFFYQAKNLYMKNDGKIFFVITKGVITGSHASRFRNFNGFKNVRIWTFDKKIEKIFNIDFICLFAEKTREIQSDINREIPAYHFTIEKEKDSINYFDVMNLVLKEKKILVPYNIEKKNDKIFTKKLITIEENKELIPSQISIYKKLFHKGADLNPRNLIFIVPKDINEDLVKVNPDKRIFKRAKDPWLNKEFCNETLEKKYIFKVVKSTELVKFYIHDDYHVFLPLSKKDLSFNYSELSKNARIFYDKINKIYLKLKKSTTKHDSLMDNLNRWSKLINKRQLARIKVVYNNSGSVLNSAVVQGKYLITGDLSFYDTENLNEAYYLLAILNSELMSNQIKIKKSSRHIFKIPFEIAIKKFDNRNINHQKIAELGKRGEKIAKSTIQ